MVSWAEVRYQHVQALRALLIDSGAKPATINHVLAAVRGAMREAWRIGLIDAETLALAVDAGNVTASTLPSGRHVAVGEIRRLVETCGDSPIGARDAAMLAPLYGCGIRRSEAVAVALEDYNEGAVTVLTAKGRKERIVYCPANGREAVDDWPVRRGSCTGALLCPVTKGGRVRQRGMAAQALMLRIRVLAERAKVT